MKYGNLNLGQVEAMVNKLGGMDAVNKLLRGELVVSGSRRSWYEENGVIYFTVTSDAASGNQWISRLESKGFSIEDDAKSALLSEDFQPTSNIAYDVAIVKGNTFRDGCRSTEEVRKNAECRQFNIPNAEIACLIRENFSDQELKTMGIFHIMIMHEPIKFDTHYVPVLLGSSRNRDESRLSAVKDDSNYPWSDNVGFAFVVSQVKLNA